MIKLKPAAGRRRTKTKTFRIVPVHTTVTARKTHILTVKLPKAAHVALEADARESARFTLVVTNDKGTGRVTAKIPRFELVKK